MSYVLRIVGITTLLTILVWWQNSYAKPFLLHDQVLDDDTVWSEEVNIKGVVVVSRKATLTIEPGTVIRFHKIDRNQDGVGDSEIRVLGRLLAKGSQQNRIRFISAENNPSPQDWSYLLFFTSGKKSIVRYAEFNHAYSGIQVHFSTVEISESFFSQNYEGLRFGRADLSILNNTFANNRTGIRFTRMEGPAIIAYNQISQNRTGIFLAPSGQNIKDFFDPEQSGKAWNTGRLFIHHNNIHDNDGYNITLGAKQKWDLDVAGNWWGTNNHKTIKQLIYDQQTDSMLGRVLYQPFEQKLVKEAGCSYNKKEN